MSLAALIGGFPGDWGRSLVAGLDRANCLGAAAAVYCLLCAARMTFAVAGSVLGFYLLSRRLTGHWSSAVVPAAAVLAILAGPTGSTTGSLHSVPVGLLAVIGSFLLFGLGTLAALAKHRWNRTD